MPLSFVTLTLALGAQHAADTPAMAVIMAAARAPDRPAPRLRIPSHAFSVLPRPGPGMTFVARPDAQPRVGEFGVTVEAHHARRVVARRAFVFVTESEPRTEVVARRVIDAGAVIRASDLEVRPATATSGDTPGLPLDAVVGKVAKYALGEGVSIRGAAIRARFEVRRGQKVRVLVRAGPLVVSTSAKAMTSGGREDVVRVRNARSKRVFDAVVIGPGLAEVREP